MDSHIGDCKGEGAGAGLPLEPSRGVGGEKNYECLCLGEGGWQQLRDRWRSPCAVNGAEAPFPAVSKHASANGDGAGRGGGAALAGVQG
jgi:hypothetical protein